LTNQRNFRQRRENYVRTLESRTAKLESSFIETQNEILSLQVRIALLERILAQENNEDECGGNVANVSCNTPIYRSIEESQRKNPYQSIEGHTFGMRIAVILTCRLSNL
jgi:hypothetical protein